LPRARQKVQQQELQASKQAELLCPLWLGAESMEVMLPLVWRHDDDDNDNDESQPTGYAVCCTLLVCMLACYMLRTTEHSYVT
jgi:hypothetical protein